MTDGWYEDAAWDDPIKLSRDSGCDLKHFSAACRNFRDELNNEELRISSNQDLIAIVRSPRYKHRDWWQYVDPAASRSAGHENSTAIILWECENHVLTCRKIRSRWSLVPGHALTDLIDVTESHQAHFSIHRNHGEVPHEQFQDDEIDDIISFVADVEDHDLPNETTENDSTSIHEDLEEEDTEHSLLILDRELEKSSENEQQHMEHKETANHSSDPQSNSKFVNQQTTSAQVNEIEIAVAALTNKLHKANDEVAHFKHQLRIEKEHNLSLQQSNQYLAKKYEDLNSKFESTVDKKIESERKTLRHRIEQLESRVEELKNIEKTRNGQIKQLSDEVLRLKRIGSDREKEISQLNYSIERQENEIIRLNHTIEDMTSELEINEDVPSLESNVLINAELESLKSSVELVLNRENILAEQLAMKTENSAQLEKKIRELSEKLLQEQENNSKNAKVNRELNEALIETREKFELALATERIKKSFEIQELKTAHELELTDVNSRHDLAFEKNIRLDNQIAELDKSIITLKSEKNLNDRALAKLEEMVSLLDERLPEIEEISDDNQTFDSNLELKKHRKFLRRNQKLRF